MAFKLQGKIDGLGEVLARLDSLEKKVKKKLLRRAVSKAGQIVLRAAKSKVQKKTGLLRKSLGRKVKVFRGSGVAVAIVGPRTGFKQEVTREGRKVMSNPTKYSHLVEKGTSHSQAYPFLQPALDDNVDRIRAAMTEIIKDGIAKGG